MKKRMLSLFLAVYILCSLFIPVCAVGTETSMVPSYAKYCEFMGNKYQTFFQDRLYLATLDACSDLDSAIELASKLIDEDLSVERCTEILANMVSLMNYQLEDAIVEQAKIDTTKTLLDYGVDAAGIAAGVIGSDSLKKSCDAVMKRITTTIGITNGTLEFTVSTIEELELLVQIEGDYAMQYDFLETVYMYADIPEMREAAQLLISANNQIMHHKLETLTSIGNSFAKFEAHDIFLDEVAGELLEDPDFWDSEVWLPLTVLSTTYSLYSTVTLAFDITMFLGDSLFGTSDIYNRYNEMVAMRDIRNALHARVKANPALNETDYDNMERNISLLKMSLYVDARGEYCVYKMVTEDGKLTKFFVSVNEKSVEKNYNTSISIINYAFELLDDLYEPLESQPLSEAKRLARVKCCSTDGISREAVLSYNENDLLVNYTEVYHSDYGDNTREYQLSYDQNNRLVQYKDSVNIYPSEEYRYSDDGKLAGWSYWDYDNAESERRYICEYDDQGKLVREYTEDGMAENKYIYDEHGYLISDVSSNRYENSAGTTTTTYMYDDHGRMIERTSERSGPYSSSSDRVRYSYDYAPFVLIEHYNDGNWDYGELRLQDGVPELLMSFGVGKSPNFEMQDGYLSKVISDGYTCEFYYDGDMPADSTTPDSSQTTPKEQVPVANTYQDILTMYHTSISCNWTNCDGEGWDTIGDPDNVCYILPHYESSRTLEEVGYCLLDINNDGQDELFISSLDTTNFQSFYDMYTICNGEVLHVISAGERDRYNLAVDNSINNDGSSSALITIYHNYRLDSTAGRLKINQAVVHDAWENEKNPWFYAEGDYYDEETYEYNFDILKSISEEESHSLLAGFPQNTPLELTPFSEYSPSMS